MTMMSDNDLLLDLGPNASGDEDVDYAAPRTPSYCPPTDTEEHMTEDKKMMLTKIHLHHRNPDHQLVTPTRTTRQTRSSQRIEGLNENMSTISQWRQKLPKQKILSSNWKDI